MPRTLFRHPLVHAVGFPVQTATGEAEYLRLELADWVNVVAVTEDRQLVLVRQHRWGVQASSLEVPGGGIDPNERPEDAARRELREETGYGGGTLRSLGWTWPNPALQNNRIHLFAIEGCRLLGPPELDPGEQDLTVELHPVERVKALVAEGAVRHSLVVLALGLWGG